LSQIPLCRARGRLGGGKKLPPHPSLAGGADISPPLSLHGLRRGWICDRRGKKNHPDKN